jgi:DNA-binding response OmpR family regulator
MATTVLVVEDDDGIAAPLVRTLEREGYDVVHVESGVEGVEQAARPGVGLVLLDLGLPDIDGLEVCRRIRDAGSGVPIMMLTARGGELDRVVGLDAGADDYLAKPFGLAELHARVRALLRRSATVPAAPAPAAVAPPPERPRGLRIDAGAHRVWVGEDEVSLTTKEFAVLALLSEDRGAVVTRERLMDEVWDSNWYGSTKTLDVTVGRLRQKLEEASSPSRVVTVRGVGFRLEDDGPDA